MTNFDILHQGVERVNSEDDGERLAEILDALSSQALGRSIILMEQAGLDSPAGAELVKPETDEDDETFVRSNN